MQRRDKTTLARVPFRPVLFSMVAFWALYFVLATLRGYLIGLEFQNELLVRRLVVTVFSIGVTILLWLLLRWFDSRTLGQRFAIAFIAALPASLVIAFINTQVFMDVEARAIEKMGRNQGVSVRRDDSGNILVEVPEMPAPPAPPPAPAPPGPGEVGPVPTAAPVPPVPSALGEEGHAPGEGELVIDQKVQRSMLWLQLTDVALGRYFLLLAWAALYFAMTQAEHARLAERREGEYRRAAKASELKSLRYQVNPHFLFNTLNSLSALVVTGRTEQAEEMIQTISTFYRRSLTGDPSEDVSLGEEIELQRLYLQIESVRFPDRLRFEIDVPDALRTARIPGMILQPLIENSVKYAVARVTRTVTIRIKAEEEFQRLVLTVSDNGPGDDGSAEHGTGIGLDNVRNRLAARFGDDGSLVSKATGEGWRTVIRIPIEGID